MITWVDVLLALVLAAFTAAGAHRKLIGFFVGIGGVLVVRPLLTLGDGNPWLAAAFGLAVGVLLGLLGRRLYNPGRGVAWPFQVLGGVGGGALGLVLLAALITSLPLQRNPANTAEIFYPPRNLPAGLTATLQRSPLITMGRSILFYPLLPQEQYTAAEQSLYGGMHRWLVIGEPWRDL